MMQNQLIFDTKMKTALFPAINVISLEAHIQHGGIGELLDARTTYSTAQK